MDERIYYLGLKTKSLIELHFEYEEVFNDTKIVNELIKEVERLDLFKL